MLSFIIPLIVSGVFAILAILCLLISFFKEKSNGKFTKFASLFSAIVSFVLLFTTNVPVPSIYPLDNETTEYDEKVEVTIESYFFIDTYYTLDGSNPIDGERYNGKITLTESTTVSAKNHFLWWWSEVGKSSYKIKDNSSPEVALLTDMEEMGAEIDTDIDAPESEASIEDDEEEVSNEHVIVIDRSYIKTDLDNSVDSGQADDLESPIAPEPEPVEPERISSESAQTSTQPETKSADMEPEPLSEPVQTNEQTSQSATEINKIYTITLMDKRGKYLGNRKLLITCNGSLVAEVYTDDSSTFYLSSSEIDQSYNQYTVYELKLCREDGQEPSEYCISGFDLSGDDFIVLCDAYLE